MGIVPMAAQETYENAKIVTEDLNGTARYVGMGGAMDALGADISTISSNPAGIGLYRKSWVGFSAGIINQEGAQNFAGGKKTNISLDQAGFVWSNRWNETNWVNFAFNYHKSRNFNQIMSIVDNLNGASQNKATVAKNDEIGLYPENKFGVPNFNEAYIECSILDDLYAKNLNYDPIDMQWYRYDGEIYAYDRQHDGYIGQYNFNLSGNVNNRFFWGITIGMHDVHYNHYGEYSENLIGGLGGIPINYGVTITDERRIKGQGADVKLGVIFRPIEDSPLRFGISVATPTWYTLTTSSYTTFRDNTGYYDSTPDEYKFKLYTPWKFGLSAGHTIDDYLAIGLGYELVDYSSMDTRYITDSYADYDDSESDKAMNIHTDKTLRTVSTFKAGLEFKPDPSLAIRLGYNYVSPMYQKDAYKDTWIDSYGSYHSSTSDFTNWDCTHRITCGLGYKYEGWNFDVAYQYSVQKGYFAPFDSYEYPEYDFYNVANMVDVKNKRHQLLFTVGYTF